MCIRDRSSPAYRERAGRDCAGRRPAQGQAQQAAAIPPLSLIHISIVFTEGTDARILSAASRLLAGTTLKVILLGEVEAVKQAAAEGGSDITGAEIIDPAAYADFDEMVAKMVELRKGKMTDEQCRAALSKGCLLYTSRCV